MPSSARPDHLPRHLAVGMLLFIGCTFATNHIAARIAFDDGTGLLLALMCRSGLSLLTLVGLVLWQRGSLRLPAGLGRWQLVLGLLIALQSLCLYSAVARIPVALALLIGNLFPIMLALLTWALGGQPPTRRASLLMGIILIGLVLVLDLPAWIASDQDMGPDWVPGILFGFGGASFFAVGVWITEHRLSTLAGPVRSLYTILIVFSSMVAAGVAGVLPGGMDTPASGTGWLALAALSILYTTAFSLLFISIPRLDMARNAPVMNIEPVASLIMGWLLLNQFFNGRQLIGGAIVLGCIVALAYSKKR
ncbi:DMT family transporter [Castellaniella sp. GW247-6E4]|uniref:EamA family transporter n=1 Tax=Castellaniella sp. GW247-6E4 TaxID=3140380 RepID=UPI0033157AC8